MITIDEGKCINCGACAFECEGGALDFFAESKIIYSANDCMECYECIEVCEQNAITKRKAKKSNISTI